MANASPMPLCRAPAGIALLLGLAAMPQPARAELDAASLQRWGGRWSVACANPTAPSLEVRRNSLTVLAGGKQISGSNVRPSYAFFGQMTPENFDAALLSDVRPDVGLGFLVWRDAGGAYIELNADAPVERALRPLLGSALRGKFRQCAVAGASAAAADPAAPQQFAPVAPPPPAAPARERFPSDLLREPGFRAGYLAALGSLSREPWLRRLDGPSVPLRNVQVGGVTYTLAAACKPHDCGDNNVVLLHAPGSARVYGKALQQGRRFVLIGNPPPAIATALDRLWRAEWRQSQR